MIKTYKIFGIRVLEVETSDERPQGLIDKLKKPQGALLEYTPKEKDREEERQLEKRI